MIICNRDSCIRIPVTDEIKTQEWFRQIQKFLIRKEVPYGEKSDVFEYKKYYHVDIESKELMIPRHYPVPKDKVQIVDRVVEGKEIDIKCKISPRDEMQKEGIEWMSQSDQGILCMQPGQGKTVVTIAAICKVKRKAIIYVHKDSLVKQWYDRFVEHTEAGVGQIRQLRTSKYKEDLLEADVVITTAQAMCSLIKRKPDLFEIMKKAEFGFAVWDECHTCAGAEQYSKSSLFTPVKRAFGLSATPNRSDGNTDIMELNLGKIYIPQNQDISTMIPKIVQLKFKHGLFPRHERWLMRNTEWDAKQGYKAGELDRDRYLKSLVTSQASRYLKVMSTVIKDIDNSGRIMILLSDRIKILDELATFCKNKEEVGFFLPRSGKDRDLHLTRRLVFSTYGSCRDGVDKKEVDCLVLANPVGNWEQAIGRAIRACEGKKQPVIIDVVDLDVEGYVRWAEKRKEQYLEKGWKVEERIIKF